VFVPYKHFSDKSTVTTPKRNLPKPALEGALMDGMGVKNLDTEQDRQGNRLLLGDLYHPSKYLPRGWTGQCPSGRFDGCGTLPC
jgi:hypothetical protein